MFCQNCGREIEDGASFCTNCGKSVYENGPEKAQMDAEYKQIEDGGQAPEVRKGKKTAVICVVSAVTLLLAAGVTGTYFYVTGDSYVSRKNMELAEECYDAEDYREALSYCEEALERDPALTDAYLMCADILLADEEYGEAVQILERGLKKTREDETSQELLEEKISEVDQAETAAVTGRLQKYLEQELVPQYGYAEMGPQTKEFDFDMLSSYGPSEEELHWTGISGIAVARVCDWDGDGRDELLTATLEGRNVDLCVYEVEGKAVIKKAECSVERADDVTVCDEIWSLLDVESGRYLYRSWEYRGVIVEDSRSAAELYRYDGENLYTPLVFKFECDPVSDACWASQYNENGEFLLGETVYHFEHDGPDWEISPDRAYCESRITELFAEYGIVWDPDENRPAADRGNEELMRFHMWYDYRNRNFDDGTYVYHFNDQDSPLLIYERFLQGEGTLRMRGDVSFGDGREEWTYQDILDAVRNTYLEYSDHDISGVEYAFMDCGDDGVEEMQLRFRGLDIYAPGDDSDLTVVISCRDGQLELIYSCESWARSGTDIDYYGCVSSGGSAGAGAYVFELGYIDGNGDFQTVYDAEDLWGWSMSSLSMTAYDTAFSGLGGYEPDIEIACYRIDGEEYCVLYYSEDLWECQYFIALCEQEGIRFVTEEEVNLLIGQRLAELGVKESWETGNGLYWNDWQ